jgi:hypothetical protein
MKATDAFKTVISDHLLALAIKDPLFAATLEKKNKNIDDCVTYIMNQVKSSGRNGYADAEVFGMAVHYYDEDDIKVGAPISGKVVVNHSLAATTAPASAPRPVVPKPKPTKKQMIVNQPSLF